MYNVFKFREVLAESGYAEVPTMDQIMDETATLLNEGAIGNFFTKAKEILGKIIQAIKNIMGKMHARDKVIDSKCKQISKDLAARVSAAKKTDKAKDVIGEYHKWNSDLLRNVGHSSNSYLSMLDDNYNLHGVGSVDRSANARINPMLTLAGKTILGVTIPDDTNDEKAKNILTDMEAECKENREYYSNFDTEGFRSTIRYACSEANLDIDKTASNEADAYAKLETAIVGDLIKGRYFDMVDSMMSDVHHVNMSKNMFNMFCEKANSKFEQYKNNLSKYEGEFKEHAVLSDNNNRQKYMNIIQKEVQAEINFSVKLQSYANKYRNLYYKLTEKKITEYATLLTSFVKECGC